MNKTKVKELLKELKLETIGATSEYCIRSSTSDEITVSRDENLDVIALQCKDNNNFLTLLFREGEVKELIIALTKLL